jgi:peptidoglycan/LPS O-acetylase OafA/YrhL
MSNETPKSVMTETKSPAQLEYRRDIDGLRAIAVMLVLVFHFSLLPAINAGFLGVDIFFVISGFLITRILQEQLSSGSFSLRTFYLNRIRRLAPALSATLFVVILAGALWLFPSDLVELAKQVLASQFYVANIYYWRSINYFGLTANDVYLLHTWSLGVEEQFYLLYPIFCILVYRYLKKYFWFVLLFGLVVSFSVNILFVARKPELTFYLLPTRAWQLLMGAMALWISDRWKRTPLQDEILGLRLPLMQSSRTRPAG